MDYLVTILYKYFFWSAGENLITEKKEEIESYIFSQQMRTKNFAERAKVF